MVPVSFPSYTILPLKGQDQNMSIETFLDNQDYLLVFVLLAEAESLEKLPGLLQPLPPVLFGLRVRKVLKT